MSRCWTVLAALLVFAATAVADDEPPVPPEVSSAVAARADHEFNRARIAFFAGDHAACIGFADRAIALDPNDARYYYFRGLAALRQGNAKQAAAEFRAGSALERRDGQAVDRSLERVQGRERAWLDAFRGR